MKTRLSFKMYILNSILIGSAILIQNSIAIKIKKQKISSFPTTDLLSHSCIILPQAYSFQYPFSSQQRHPIMRNSNHGSLLSFRHFSFPRVVASLHQRHCTASACFIPQRFRSQDGSWLHFQWRTIGHSARSCNAALFISRPPQRNTSRAMIFLRAFAFSHSL